MATSRPRLNVVLDPNQYLLLIELAKKQDKSLSLLAKELIQDSMDRHEDIFLSKLAQRRESKSKRNLSHVEAWK